MDDSNVKNEEEQKLTKAEADKKMEDEQDEEERKRVDEEALAHKKFLAKCR